jgi:acetolactate synthase-1/2/3 large subunit
MASPRAKGLFPENHPLYLGSTGLGGQPGVERHFRLRRPAHVLVLGTRLSEPTSFWNPALVPSEAFLHVDVDPSVPGAAYPEARTVAIHAEARGFLRALLAELGEASAPGRMMPEPLAAPETLEPRSEGPVRPQVLMRAVQRVVVEKAGALVMSESGNAFAWSNQLLRFPVPGGYRVSTGFGSMGHMATGVVGAALATGKKAVALVGDGSMLMQSEVSTAVQYGAEAVWVVLNDSQYGMVEQGMRALGFTPLETAMPHTDFAAWARAQGAVGLSVTTEDALEAVLDAAMEVRGPCVVDVRLDGEQTAPWMRRIQNLIVQGAERAAVGGK